MQAKINLGITTVINRRLGELRMSNAELGRRIGVSGEMVRQYRDGATPGPDKIGPIATALEVPLEDLRSAIEGPEPDPYELTQEIPQSDGLAVLATHRLVELHENGRPVFTVDVTVRAAPTRTASLMANPITSRVHEPQAVHPQSAEPAMSEPVTVS